MRQHAFQLSRFMVRVAYYGRSVARYSEIWLGFGVVHHRIDSSVGKYITVYGQHDIVRDLDAHLAADEFASEVNNVTLHI